MNDITLYKFTTFTSAEGHLDCFLVIVYKTVITAWQIYYYYSTNRT